MRHENRFLDISPLIVGFTRQMAYGLILVLFMCFRPQGLLGEFGRKKLRKSDDTGTVDTEDGSSRRVNIKEVETVLGTSRAKESADTGPLLELQNVSRSFGGIHAVSDCTLSLKRGAITGLIGPNGAGKTTLLKSIFGLLRPWEGRIVYQGRDIAGRRTEVNVREGVSYMPQGQGLFPDLSVMDNLDLGDYALGKTASGVSMDQVMDLFPILGSRRHQKAGTLSGGEQRMLSLGIALKQSPKLLLLDEPSIGLAPIIVQNVMETIRQVNYRLKTGIVIVEQNIEATSRIVDRIFIIKVGKIVFSGGADIASDKQRLWDLF